MLVVGIGPAGPELTSATVRRAVNGARRAYLRTGRHPAAAAFPGTPTFDALYERASTFEEVYQGIVEVLVTAAAEEGSVVYAVPGSPLVAERTVELLRADPRITVSTLPALSFLDLAWDRLGVDPLAEGVRLVDGTRFAVSAASERGPLLVAQCWSSAVLSDIKLSLDVDAASGPEPVVTVLSRLGLEDEDVRQVPWADLDRLVRPDHLTSMWIPVLGAPVAAELVALDELVRTLRQRCPWDRAQTHESLRRHLLEESYELLDAIDELSGAVALDTGSSGGDSAEVSGAVAHLEEELGDVLFQVFFHSCLAAEEGRFTVADVARGVSQKLVARHPHVFGDVVADSPAAVAANWEVLKTAEKGRKSVTDGVPSALPALALAVKWKGAVAGIEDAARPQSADKPVRSSTGCLGPRTAYGSRRPRRPRRPRRRAAAGRGRPGPTARRRSGRRPSGAAFALRYRIRAEEARVGAAPAPG